MVSPPWISLSWPDPSDVGNANNDDKWEYQNKRAYIEQEEIADLEEVNEQVRRTTGKDRNTNTLLQSKTTPN